MKKFKEGDRVVCLVDRLRGSVRVNKGSTGTVCTDEREGSSGRVRIRWDYFVGGHSCGGFCEEGFGLNAEDYEIDLLEEEKEEATCADIDISSFLWGMT